MKQQALYRFWDADGALLYIGISLDPGKRWKQHRDDKPWWSEVAKVTVEPHPSRPAAMDAERAAIAAERPRYNVVHNSGIVDHPEMRRMRELSDALVEIREVARYGMPHTWKLLQRGLYAEVEESIQDFWRIWHGEMIERAAHGTRVHAYLTEVRRTRLETVVGVIGHCPFCGRSHTHGLGVEGKDPYPLLGWRSSHCMNGDYYITANLAASYVGFPPLPQKEPV